MLTIMLLRLLKLLNQLQKQKLKKKLQLNQKLRKKKRKLTLNQLSNIEQNKEAPIRGAFLLTKIKAYK
jgi:hypothetical protein